MIHQSRRLSGNLKSFFFLKLSLSFPLFYSRIFQVRNGAAVHQDYLQYLADMEDKHHFEERTGAKLEMKCVDSMGLQLILRATLALMFANPHARAKRVQFVEFALTLFRSNSLVRALAKEWLCATGRVCTSLPRLQNLTIMQKVLKRKFAESVIE